MLNLRAMALVIILPVLFAAAPVPPVVPVAGKIGTPVPLFNGKDLTGWTWHSATATSKIGDVWTVKDGVLHCAGKPLGFIDTDKEYKNFTLTVEYRHLTRDNGGTFVCITGDEKAWATQWPNSIQIQGKFGSVGDLINQNTGMKNMTTDPARSKKSGKDILITRLPAAPGQQPEKPLGEWNTLIITMENGNLSVTNNGILLNTASEISPDSGKIGIQAEGAEMEFKKVEMTPIEPPSGAVKNGMKAAEAEK